MKFTRDELKRLALPLLIAVVLLGTGAGLIWSADRRRRG